MRLEIIASGGTGVSVFGMCLADLSLKTYNAANSFVAVKTNVNNMTGGTSGLEDALDNVNSRIKSIEKQGEKLVNFTGKVEDFLTTAKRVDSSVGFELTLDNVDFVKKNPWANIQSGVQKHIDNAFDWLKKKFSDFGKAVENFGKGFVKMCNDFGKGVEKIWTSTVDFVKEHAKAFGKIIISAGIIVGMAVLSLAFPVAGIFAGMAAISALGNVVSNTVNGIVSGKSSGEIIDDIGEDIVKDTINGGMAPAVTLSGIVGGPGARAVAGGVSNTVATLVDDSLDYYADHGNIKGYVENSVPTLISSFFEGVASETIDMGTEKIGHIICGKLDIKINKGKDFNSLNPLQKKIRTTAITTPSFAKTANKQLKFKEWKSDYIWAFNVKTDARFSNQQKIYNNALKNSLKELNKTISKKVFDGIDKKNLISNVFSIPVGQH